MENIFDTKPDSINEKGVKWWVDKDLTKYAREPNPQGTTLERTTVFAVEEPNGHKTRLIVQQPEPPAGCKIHQQWQEVFESQRLEDIAVHIDIMKLDKEHNGNRSETTVCDMSEGQTPA